MAKREMKVYIKTVSDKYIGTVLAETKEEYYDKADKLWKEKGYDSPTLCYLCSKKLELGDWEIDEMLFDMEYGEPVEKGL